MGGVFGLHWNEVPEGYMYSVCSLPCEGFRRKMVVKEGGRSGEWVA